MSPLALPVAVHNISSFFLFASVPVGIIGFILAIRSKDWLFAFLNCLGAFELIIAALISHIFYCC